MTTEAPAAPTGAQRLADVKKCLSLRYFGAPAGYTVAVHTIAATAGTGGARRITNDFRQVHDWKDLKDLAQEIVDVGAGRHVYTRMTMLKDQPTKGRGSESDPSVALCAWVDCDVAKNNLSFEDVLETLRGMTPQPTAIEFSGGGYYALWRFTEPLEDWRRLKRINTWLASQLSNTSQNRCGADSSTVDAARILRVAGTFNAKPTRQTWASVVDYNRDRVYDINSFGEETAPEGDSETYYEESIPEGFIYELKGRDELTYKRLLSEATAREAGAALNGDGAICRHKNDLRIAMALLRLGYSTGLLVGVFTHPQWFSGSKFREEHAINYVYRTIKKAETLVKGLSENCFNGAKLIPSRVAQEIMLDFHYLWSNGRLYVYDPDKGIYTEDGELHLRLVLQERLADKWSTNMANSVVEWIKTDVQSKNVIAPEPEPSDWLNVQNGMLNLKTRVLLPHDHQYNSTTQLPVRYDPWADKTKIDRFVREIIHEQDSNTWWNAVGYCLLNHAPFKTAFFLYGKPDSGKSALLNVLLAFIGRKNTCSVSPGDLSERFSAVGMLGRVANIVPELDTESLIRTTDIFKKSVDGSLMEFERKGQDRFTGVIVAKSFLAGNNYPRIKSGDAGFYRRFHVLHCENVFVEGVNADPMLPRSLAADGQSMSAMLNLALDGLAALLQQGGFVASKRTNEKAEEMQQASDGVLDFWQNDTVLQPDFQIEKKEMYDCYVLATKEAGREPVTRIEFGRRTENLISKHATATRPAQIGRVEGLYESNPRRDGQQVRCYAGRMYINDYKRHTDNMADRVKDSLNRKDTAS